jgi:integrase
MDKYINQLRKEIRLGRYSYQTERAYVGWVKRYLKFLHKRNIQGNYEDEVKSIMRNLSGVKKIIVSLLYGSGLRISECLRLRILDLDFDYQQIEIRNSKGNRDRVSILPESIINPLKHHIKTPAQKRLRHPNRPGTPRTQEREDNHDLYPRPQQGRQRRKKSAGQLMISVITNLI